MDDHLEFFERWLTVTCPTCDGRHSVFSESRVLLFRCVACHGSGEYLWDWTPIVKNIVTAAALSLVYERGVMDERRRDWAQWVANNFVTEV